MYEHDKRCKGGRKGGKGHYWVEWVIALAVPFILLTATVTHTGCTDAGGIAWSPVAPGADPILVNAERADQSAYETVTFFLKTEYANRDLTKQYAPAIHDFAEKLRAYVPNVEPPVQTYLYTFRQLRQARATYKLTRTSGDATTLEQQLQNAQAMASQARLFTAMIREQVEAKKRAPTPPPS